MLVIVIYDNDNHLLKLFFRKCNAVIASSEPSASCCHCTAFLRTKNKTNKQHKFGQPLLKLFPRVQCCHCQQRAQRELLSLHSFFKNKKQDKQTRQTNNTNLANLFLNFFSASAMLSLPAASPARDAVTAQLF